MLFKVGPDSQCRRDLLCGLVFLAPILVFGFLLRSGVWFKLPSDELKPYIGSFLSLRHVLTDQILCDVFQDHLLSDFSFGW